MGTAQLVGANQLLRELLGHVVIRPDPEAADGAAIEVWGDLSRILLAGEGDKQKGLPEEALVSASQILVVAGARNYRYRHKLEVMI
jgi:hypothetical protein